MRSPRKLFWFLLLALTPIAALAQPAGRDLYMQRCFWCHGETGRGDGPSAVGMFPRPRDFARADYKIRSTPGGQLPTDDDLFRVISRGMPGTPMPGWKNILSKDERWQLVRYLKSLSPRFQSEKPDALTIPGGAASIERGKEVYRNAKCFLCHGEAGRADGGITTTLNFAWGLPRAARDLTRGWSFLGEHEPREIYLRITGGLNGTPMGPYQDLLNDQERWDLAHYVASLDQEPTDTSEDFLITAALVRGELPQSHDAAQWKTARPVLAPLAGQVVVDPPLRWWMPTAVTATVRALWNGREVAFLLEWNDPTGSVAAADAAPRADGPFVDSAFLQFAAGEGTKPNFLLGDGDNPVKLWHWQAGDATEEWTANGPGKVTVAAASFRVSSTWNEGRWHVLFRRALAGEPKFAAGSFVPILISLRDGANAESDNVRALSTWLYATLERPPSARPWLLALACVLATVIIELRILFKVRR